MEHTGSLKKNLAFNFTKTNRLSPQQINPCTCRRSHEAQCPSRKRRGRCEVKAGVGHIIRLAETTERGLTDQRRLVLFGKILVMSVSMKPGAMQLTVMPREPISRASDIVMPTKPALAAA